ncbi:MAG: hypothetical protein NZ744_15900 [Pirellulaceae bacterium]|nr:hypothetical protein [Pirellulaceae bacterium]
MIAKIPAQSDYECDKSVVGIVKLIVIVTLIVIVIVILIVMVLLVVMGFCGRPWRELRRCRVIWLWAGSITPRLGFRLEELEHEWQGAGRERELRAAGARTGVTTPTSTGGLEELGGPQ